MPSPFPGMDPYLERPSIWPGFHALLISATAMSLGPRLAPRYYVAVEERTYIAFMEPSTFIGRPDMAVMGMPTMGLPMTPTAYPLGRPYPLPAAPIGGPPVAVLERPVTVTLPVPEQVRERYLEVRDTATHKVITVVEILSPANKQPGEGRRQYERKSRQVADSLTTLVEIDLLCGGEPLPMGRIPASHYRILVSRGWERPQARLYPFNLDEPIPEIPIPLCEGEAEPGLNLGDLLAQVYDQVRYDLRIDYTTEPEPPLDSDVAAWANSLLSQAGRRG